MEIGVRFLGFLQLLLRWITWPLFSLWARQEVKKLPPLTNPLLRLSASQIAAKIRTGEVKSQDVVKAFVNRIQEVNPLLNAVVEDRFSAAMEDARAVDLLVASGRKTQRQMEEDTPFLGVPITVKESCSLNGMSLCVGSLPRVGIKADFDGDAAKLLKKAGAIPLAVTTTPELCLSWETNNLVTGKTNNPYCLLRTSGGSSGGEAALQGAGATIISIASDIAGSIRIPAMFNGIFGHKPTPGYVSLLGHYPNAASQDFAKYLVIGPLARYAEDLRPALKVMAGDSAAKLKLDEKVDLGKLKLFYMEEAGFSLIIVQVENEIKERLRQAVQYLNKQHGIPVQKGGFKELEDSVEISAAVFFGMDGIPDLLQDPNNPKASHNIHVELLKSFLGLSQFSTSALAFSWLLSTNVFIPRHKYQDYCRQRNALRNKFQDKLGENGVFLYPTHPTPAFYHNQVYTMTAGVLYTMIFNVLGMPSTHVPLGLNSQGMPIGIQVVATPHQDRLCLAVAQELEKAFGGWVPPPAATVS